MKKLIVASIALVLAACHQGQPNTWQGWVEADMMFIGAEDSGRLVELPVTEGQSVRTGDQLFAIEASTQQADLESAQAALAQATARLQRVVAAQQRPEEIAVLEATRQQMEAALAFSTAELTRTRALNDRSFASRQQLEQAQANYDRDRAGLDNVMRQIDVGRLSGRQEDIDAARYSVEQARAQVASAQVRVDRARVRAKADGRIQEIYYRPGEVVTPDKPVVSLLPPNQIKIRFFVPQANLPMMQIGGKVKVSCDGCAQDTEATISFISQTNEFTPPVIYTLEERQKLVFRIEALPADPEKLRIGQPVTVRLP